MDKVIDWLVVLGGLVSVLVLFLVFADAFLENTILSYAVFLIVLIIIAILLIRVVLPRPSPYVPVERGKSNDHLRRDGKGVASQALVGHLSSQLTLYVNLKTALLARVKTRRRIPDENWQKVLRDPVKLRELIQDKELFHLSQIIDVGTRDLEGYQTHGLVFGEEFPSCFHHLLSKVEGWR